jgi:hypothetical protein
MALRVLHSYSLHGFCRVFSKSKVQSLKTTLKIPLSSLFPPSSFSTIRSLFSRPSLLAAQVRLASPTPSFPLSCLLTAGTHPLGLSPTSSRPPPPGCAAYSPLPGARPPPAFLTLPPPSTPWMLSGALIMRHRLLSTRNGSTKAIDGRLPNTTEHRCAGSSSPLSVL